MAPNRDQSDVYEDRWKSLFLQFQLLSYFPSSSDVFYLSYCRFLVLSLCFSTLCVSKCFFALYFCYPIPNLAKDLQKFWHYVNQNQNLTILQSTGLRSTSGQWSRKCIHSSADKLFKSGTPQLVHHSVLGACDKLCVTCFHSTVSE